MQPTMEELPPELLFYILCKLDGHSLAQASGVNHLWRTMVSNMGSVFNIWFRICLKEIGLESIIAQTGLTYLASESGQAQALSCNSQWKFWRELFVANHRCQHTDREGAYMVQHWTFRDHNMIGLTSIAIHPCSHLGGSGLVCAGLLTGSLINLSLADFSLANPSVRHNECCMSVAPLTLNGCPGYSVELKEEDFMLSISHNGQVILSNSSKMTQSLVHGLGNRVYCISSLGQYFAVGTNHSQREGVMVYRFRGMQGSAPGLHLMVGTHFQAVLRLQGCLYSDCTALALAHNQVVGGDDRGNLYCWKFAPLSHFDVTSEGGNSRHARKNCPEVVDAPSHSLQLTYGISHIVLHQGWVLALTNHGEADVHMINMKDWSQVLRIRDAALRSLAFNTASYATRLASCANLLAVGFISGEVLVFNTSSPHWTSNLSRHVVWRCRCTVNRFSSMAFSHGPTGPVLAIGGGGLQVYQWHREGKTTDVPKQKMNLSHEEVKETSASAREA